MQPEFGRVYTIQSFYEGKLSSTCYEIETQRKTNRNSYLADIMELSSEIVNGDCKELTIVVHGDHQGPKMIVVKKRPENPKGER